MNRDTARILNLVQLIAEICIGAGFLLGLIPFVYLYSSGWVIPLAIVSLILSFINKNNTFPFTITNLFLAFVSYIPIVGFVTRLIGAIVSLLNIYNLKNQLK